MSSFEDDLEEESVLESDEGKQVEAVLTRFTQYHANADVDEFLDELEESDINRNSVLWLFKLWRMIRKEENFQKFKQVLILLSQRNRRCITHSVTCKRMKRLLQDDYHPLLQSFRQIPESQVDGLLVDIPTDPRVFRRDPKVVRVLKASTNDEGEPKQNNARKEGKARRPKLSKQEIIVKTFRPLVKRGELPAPMNPIKLAMDEATGIRIAIIGAGISGSACAWALREQQCEIVAFDQHTNVGGRLGSARLEGFDFCSGCPYFTARDETFVHIVEGWIQQGVAARWDPPIAVADSDDNIWIVRRDPTKTKTPCYQNSHSHRPSLGHGNLPWYRGKPTMESISKYLLQSVSQLNLSCCIESVEMLGPQRHRLHCSCKKNHGIFNFVAICSSSEQVSRLVGGCAGEIAIAANQVKTRGTWVVLAVFPLLLDTPFDVLFVDHPTSPLQWAHRERSQEHGATQRDCWVLHAATQWSLCNMDRTCEYVVQILVKEFLKKKDSVGRMIADEPIATSAIFWKSTTLVDPPPAFDVQRREYGMGCFFDRAKGIGGCGDWCLDESVEGAFVSGYGLGQRLIEVARFC